MDRLARIGLYRWIDQSLANTDVLILGRHTYDTVLGFGKEQCPYADKPLLLLSSQSIDHLQLRDSVTLVHSIDRALAISDEKGYKDLWIDGGATIRGFLREQLITEMILTTIPIALGDGLPLFKGIGKEVKFEIIASQVMGDLLATKYRVDYQT